MTTVAMVLLMLSLAFGGSGAAVFAAQDAMPTDPLYGIKLATEDVRINAENNAQTRIELTLEFANRRMNEIATMANSGVVPPAAVMERQQMQIQTALRDAADVDDPAMKQILLRTQTMLQEQVQITEMLRVHAPDSITPILERVRERLRLQLQLTDLGLHDPQHFRTQMRQATREQSQERQKEQQPTIQPKPTAVSPQPTMTQQWQPQPPTVQPQPTAVQRQQQSSSAQPQPTAVQQQNQQQQQQQSSAQAQPTAVQNQQQSQSSAQTQATPVQQQQHSSSGSSSASSNQSGKR